MIYDSLNQTHQWQNLVVFFFREDRMFIVPIDFQILVKISKPVNFKISPCQLNASKLLGKKFLQALLGCHSLLDFFSPTLAPWLEAKKIFGDFLDTQTAQRLKYTCTLRNIGKKHWIWNDPMLALMEHQHMITHLSRNMFRCVENDSEQVATGFLHHLFCITRTLALKFQRATLCVALCLFFLQLRSTAESGILHGGKNTTSCCKTSKDKEGKWNKSSTPELSGPCIVALLLCLPVHRFDCDIAISSGCFQAEARKRSKLASTWNQQTHSFSSWLAEWSLEAISFHPCCASAVKTCRKKWLSWLSWSLQSSYISSTRRMHIGLVQSIPIHGDYNLVLELHDHSCMYPSSSSSSSFFSLTFKDTMHILQGFWPLRRIPAFLSTAQSMTWLRNGLLVINSLDRGGNTVEFVC